jgi:hypothetical protein
MSGSAVAFDRETHAAARAGASNALESEDLPVIKRRR